MTNLLPSDLSALQDLRDLARRYCAIELTFADCGCHTVSLFVGSVKIVEEDKDLSIVVENVKQKILELEGVTP